VTPTPDGDAPLAAQQQQQQQQEEAQRQQQLLRALTYSAGAIFCLLCLYRLQVRAKGQGPLLQPQGKEGLRPQGNRVRVGYS
jgi:hypothetical protein